jgi:3-oxoacyl-[acyl-carrier protein] reductase
VRRKNAKYLVVSSGTKNRTARDVECTIESVPVKQFSAKKNSHYAIINREKCTALANEGVNVGLVARTEEDLVNVAKEVEACGVKACFAQADIADIGQVNTAVNSIQERLGFIDILINNAGTGKFAKFLDLDPGEWEHIIKVNLFGSYYATRAVLPQMIEHKTGDIVNVSSSAGLKGSQLTSAYSASKFGLIGMSESLMQEVRKHNIRVMTLTPSTVATSLVIDNNLTEGDPTKVMQPEDFAQLVIAQLKLYRRVIVKDSSIWSTNP